MLKKTANLLLLFAAVTLVLNACTAAKKPDTEQRSAVVSEISDIPFETIKLENAPDVVKKKVKLMQDIKSQEFITWSSVGGKGYIIVFPEAFQKNAAVTIDKIEQRVPEQDYAWLNIKLNYAEENSRDDSDEAEPVVAKFDLKNTPNAVGFQLSRKNDKPVGKSGDGTNPSAEVQIKPKQDFPEEIEGPVLRITNPMPGDAVQSPVQITGQVGFLNGDLRVRVKNAEGEVLAEKPVEITGDGFDAAISFTEPLEQQQGFVEAVLINTQDQTETGRVSVAVYLQPQKQQTAPVKKESTDREPGQDESQLLQP